MRLGEGAERSVSVNKGRECRRYLRLANLAGVFVYHPYDDKIQDTNVRGRRCRM